MKHLAIALALVSTAASAEFFNGNDLLNRLQEPSASPMRQSALGYVAGVADTTMRIFHCAPPTATLRQAADIVQIALEAQPQDRHYSADTLVTRALQFAWPCPKKEKNTAL